jgi:hypothetical protein
MELNRIFEKEPCRQFMLAAIFGLISLSGVSNLPFFEVGSAALI